MTRELTPLKLAAPLEETDYGRDEEEEEEEEEEEGLVTSGQHEHVCKVEGSSVIRHDTIKDETVPDLKPHITSVRLEQFIHELAQHDDNTGKMLEAKMGIVAESPKLRAMLDVQCYLSTLKTE